MATQQVKTKGSKLDVLIGGAVIFGGAALLLLGLVLAFMTLGRPSAGGLFLVLAVLALGAAISYFGYRMLKRGLGSGKEPKRSGDTDVVPPRAAKPAPNKSGGHKLDALSQSLRNFPEWDGRNERAYLDKLGKLLSSVVKTNNYDTIIQVLGPPNELQKENYGHYSSIDALKEAISSEEVVSITWFSVFESTLMECVPQLKSFSILLMDGKPYETSFDLEGGELICSMEHSGDEAGQIEFTDIQELKSHPGMSKKWEELEALSTPERGFLSKLVTETAKALEDGAKKPPMVYAWECKHCKVIVNSSAKPNYTQCPANTGFSHNWARLN